jgi:hypothetical protein
MKQKSIPDPQLCLQAAKTDLRENAERISEKYEDIKVNSFSYIVNRSKSLPNLNNVITLRTGTVLLFHIKYIKGRERSSWDYDFFTLFFHIITFAILSITSTYEGPVLPCP